MVLLKAADGLQRLGSFRRAAYSSKHICTDGLTQRQGILQSRIVAATVQRGSHAEDAFIHFKLRLGGLRRAVGSGKC